MSRAETADTWADFDDLGREGRTGRGWGDGPARPGWANREWFSERVHPGVIFRGGVSAAISRVRDRELLGDFAIGFAASTAVRVGLNAALGPQGGFFIGAGSSLAREYIREVRENSRQNLRGRERWFTVDGGHLATAALVGGVGGVIGMHSPEMMSWVADRISGVGSIANAVGKEMHDRIGPAALFGDNVAHHIGSTANEALKRIPVIDRFASNPPKLNSAGWPIEPAVTDQEHRIFKPLDINKPAFESPNKEYFFDVTSKNFYGPSLEGFASWEWFKAMMSDDRVIADAFKGNIVDGKILVEVGNIHTGGVDIVSVDINDIKNVNQLDPKNGAHAALYEQLKGHESYGRLYSPGIQEIVNQIVNDTQKSLNYNPFHLDNGRWFMEPFRGDQWIPYEIQSPTEYRQMLLSKFKVLLPQLDLSGLPENLNNQDALDWCIKRVRGLGYLGEINFCPSA